jgi:uncharacterized protein GlcG (DUF336 family)
MGPAAGSRWQYNRAQLSNSDQPMPEFVTTPPAHSRGEPEDAGGRRHQGGRALPVTVNGEVIGAIAAGGAKIEQDVLVAQAALAAIGGQQT